MHSSEIANCHATLLNSKWPTLSLVPLAPVESALSLPAKSTKLILLTCLQMEMFCLRTVERSNAQTSNFSLKLPTSISDVRNAEYHLLLHSSLFTLVTLLCHNMWTPGEKGWRRGCGTFSDVFSVSLSCRFCVKMMLNTAWERLLVSFILVAATVLITEKRCSGE